MALMKKIAASQTAPAQPLRLRISTAPLPGDLHLVVYAAPDAPLGHIDLTLSAGKGSRGRGARVLDDPAFFASTLRRLAASIVVYASDFEQAAEVNSDLQAPSACDRAIPY